MHKIEIKHEGQSSIGMYVVAYVTWDSVPDGIPVSCVKEFVPACEATPRNLRKVEKLVHDCAILCIARAGHPAALPALLEKIRSGGP